MQNRNKRKRQSKRNIDVLPTFNYLPRIVREIRKLGDFRENRREDDFLFNPLREMGMRDRLNMELNVQSLLGLLCSAVIPLPPHLGSYTMALLVRQDRRNFVTPYDEGRGSILI